jgi:hypothetical protein
MATIAQTPRPPYYAVIFTSLRNNADGADDGQGASASGKRLQVRRSRTEIPDPWQRWFGGSGIAPASADVQGGLRIVAFDELPAERDESTAPVRFDADVAARRADCDHQPLACQISEGLPRGVTTREEAPRASAGPPLREEVPASARWPPPPHPSAG